MTNDHFLRAKEIESEIMLIQCTIETIDKKKIKLLDEIKVDISEIVSDYKTRVIDLLKARLIILGDEFTSL